MHLFMFLTYIQRQIKKYYKHVLKFVVITNQKKCIIFGDFTDNAVQNKNMTSGMYLLIFIFHAHKCIIYLFIDF